jgi:hypothetical protein
LQAHACRDHRHPACVNLLHSTPVHHVIRSLHACTSLQQTHHYRSVRSCAFSPLARHCEPGLGARNGVTSPRLFEAPCAHNAPHKITSSDLYNILYNYLTTFGTSRTDRFTQLESLTYLTTSKRQQRDTLVTATPVSNTEVDSFRRQNNHGLLEQRLSSTSKGLRGHHVAC